MIGVSYEPAVITIDGDVGGVRCFNSNRTSNVSEGTLSRFACSCVRPLQGNLSVRR